MAGNINITDKTIEWVNANKGKSFKYNDGLSEKVGTVVGYNKRNGLVIMRYNHFKGWSNLNYDDNEDVLVWTRFKIENYTYGYCFIANLINNECK